MSIKVYGNADPVTLQGELTVPDGAGPFPAVVMMHGCAGLSDAVRAGLQSHAAFFAQNGFASLILDSFEPRGLGGGGVCASFQELAEARSYRQDDAVDAARVLAARPEIDGENLFQLGQSNGGSVSVLLAMRGAARDDGEPAFRANAAYYPWCGAFNAASKARIKLPLIALVGDKDDWTPPTKCKSLEVVGAAYEIHAYPDATHSFDLDVPIQKYQGHTVGYDAEATRESRAAMLALFKQHLK